MRPHRSVKQIYLLTPGVAVLAACAVLLMSASAQAATTSQRTYKIFITQYKAQIAYSATKMNANLAAAESKLASTARAIDALSSSNVNAATALVNELEHQFDVAGAIGVLKPALATFNAVSKLHLTKAQHKQAVADARYMRLILAINTTADMARWQAAGYAPAKEPANTKAFGGILGVTVPSIALPVSGSTKAIKAFIKLENKASDKTTSVFNTLGNDWSAWAAGFGIQSG